MQTYPGKFQWFGEINVFKHALAANGFFHARDNPRVTVERVERTRDYDPVFDYASRNKWPVTLHSDIGCDNYDSIPSRIPHSKACQCDVPEAELERAAKNPDAQRVRGYLVSMHAPVIIPTNM